MSVINSIPLIAAGDDGYQISRSVRLRSSASASFTRTPASAGSKQKMTWSFWLKPSLSSMKTILGCSLGSSAIDAMGFDNGYGYGNERFHFFSSGAGINLLTTRRFRDPSAWYHFVVSVDTTQATNTNRVKIYVNGVQETAFDVGTYPALNANITYWNSTSQNWIGNLGPNYSVYYSDVYLTELNFIDGQQLTPSSFGETDAVTGVWKPKKYAGTYGTNGFYLNFSDNSAATAAAIGKDSSGNGNNWTPNNVSVTAGVTYDSMLDVPTMWADGGNGRGNYCTLNPLDKTSAVTLSDGNLAYSVSSGSQGRATLGSPTTGLWYFEHTITSSIGLYTPIIVGGCTNTTAVTNLNNEALVLFFYTDSSTWLVRKAVSGSATDISVSGTSYPVLGNTLQIAYDPTNGKAWLGKNNSWIDSSGGITGNPSAGTNPTFTFTAGQSLFPCLFNVGAPYSGTLNCGQRPFAYTPPTGFKALNTQNLPDATIKKGNAYFDVTTYTGTGASQNIVNAGAFQPDLVWAKRRNSAADHALVDSVRGAVKTLFSSSTAAEDTTSQTITAFNSNGFTVGNTGYTGAASDTYVGWQWKESASAGFDIVTYTGTGANRTISHSLGVAPKFMFGHIRNTAGENWFVYHANLTSAAYRLRLNTTDAQDSQPTFWNSTAPTSSVFSVGTGAPNVSGYNYVMYLFAEVAGFSKFGSYTGNASTDGPFVFCGFKPRYILIKGSSIASSWYIFDTARSTYNEDIIALNADSSGNEATALTSYGIDILSNGFKIKQPTGYGLNNSGQTYIFMALAENPFKNSLAR